MGDGSGCDDARPGRPPSAAVPDPAPVASFDGLADGAEYEAQPVARFDDDGVGGDRTDVPVADLSRVAARRRRTAGADRIAMLAERAGRPPATPPPGGGEVVLGYVDRVGRRWRRRNRRGHPKAATDGDISRRDPSTGKGSHPAPDHPGYVEPPPKPPRSRRGRLTPEMEASSAAAARQILEEAERRAAAAAAGGQPTGPGQDGERTYGEVRRRNRAEGRQQRRAASSRDAAGPVPAARPSARAGAGSTDSDPEADPLAVARAICLRLLTERARSRQELLLAMRRKAVPEEAAQAVLERFGEVGLIDDAAFAEQWVHSRHTGSKGLGRRALAAELRRKGVADEVAGEALQDVDAESEERRARELAERKLRGLPLGTPQQRAVAARRLAGMLARKGYGPGVAYRVVREAIAAHGADAEEFSTDDFDAE